MAYHWTDDLLTYASAAEGFKAGGFNTKAPVGQVSFGEEESWCYEAGVKQAWLNRRVTTNLALFYIDWQDLQLDVADATHPGSFYLDNVGAARSVGGEFEVQAKVVRGCEVFAGVGYANAEFEEYTDPIAGDVSGNQLVFVPEYTYNLGVNLTRELRHDLSVFLRPELVGVGPFSYDAGNTQGQDAYFLVHVRTGVRFGHWTAELWVRNALDADYIPVAFQPSPGMFVGESGAPRTVGCTLTATF